MKLNPMSLDPLKLCANPNTDPPPRLQHSEAVDKHSNVMEPQSSTIVKFGQPTPDTPIMDGRADIEEDDLSWEQFQQRYAPLSFLPTPPWSDSSSVEDVSSEELQALDPEFYAPAKYLVTMIPRNASRDPPSLRYLQGVLQRANLRLEVVALACCILDCLSSRFLKQWRLECCEYDGFLDHAEIIAVATLCVAMKFMEDTSYSASLWARNISEGLFSARALAATERIVLADLNYCLLGLTAPDLLEWNLVEIKRYAEAAEKSNSLAPAPTAKSTLNRASSPFPLMEHA